jgi:hypothetical protein
MLAGTPTGPPSLILSGSNGSHSDGLDDRRQNQHVIFLETCQAIWPTTPPPKPSKAAEKPTEANEVNLEMMRSSASLHDVR